MATKNRPCRDFAFVCSDSCMGFGFRGGTDAEYRELPKRFNPTKFTRAILSIWRERSASNTWYLQRSITTASACLIRPTRTTRSQIRLMARTSSGSWRMLARKGKCRLAFTTRHRTCIIRRFAIRRSNGPVQEIASLRTTAKANRVFVHVFDWTAASLAITGLNAKVIRAHMLAMGQTLTFRQDASRVQVDVAVQAPDPNVSTIVLHTL